MNEANQKRAEEVRKRLLDVADALLERAMPKKGEAVSAPFVEPIVKSAVLAYETAVRPVAIDPPPDPGRALRKAPIDPPPDPG